MIWKKDHFANALISKKAPVSYFEDINVFAKKYDKQNLHPLRGYFKKILEFVGIEPSKINSVLGHRRAAHCFYIESSQFGLCTEKTYQELIYKFEINKMNGFKEFSELKQIDKKFNRTFNLQNDKKYNSNVLEFKKDYEGLHPTQKPVALFEYLIKTYTNEGETVLDNCMGSFTTAIACLNTKRNFIGIELDKNYFKIGSERLEKHLETLDYKPEILYNQE